MEFRESKVKNVLDTNTNPAEADTNVNAEARVCEDVNGAAIKTIIRDEVKRFMRNGTDTVKEEGLISLINQAISDKVHITTKEVLNSEEAARYMGISIGSLHKLTHNRALPYYKPSGKLCFFNRRELEAWLQRNRISSKTEIADRAYMIAMRGGKR